MSKPQVFIIIPAAGFGTRMGSSIAKQFIEIAGKTILEHTYDKFLTWGKATQILVGLSENSDCQLNQKITKFSGGKERADTVLRGLQQLQTQANENDWVLVHDAARPLINIKDIDKLFNELTDDKIGGILAEQATSTVKQANNSIIEQTLPRSQIFLAQTPQMFRFDVLYRALTTTDSTVTDEASAVEQLGLAVRIVCADYPNPKITYQSDLDYISHVLGNKNEY